MQIVLSELGAKGWDTSQGPLNATQAAGLAAHAFRFGVRYVGHPNAIHNVTAQELRDITDAGEGVQLVGYFRLAGWSSETGAKDGALWALQAKAAGAPSGARIWIDLEGNGARADVVVYAIACARAIRLAGYSPGVYNGMPQLTGADLDAMDVDAFWHSGMVGIAGDGARKDAPAIGYELTQAPISEDNVTIAGVVVDLDTVPAATGKTRGPWIVSDNWHSPAPWPKPAPASDAFEFHFELGESVGDRHARCWEEALARGPMGHALRAAWYASFIDIGQGAQHIEGWSTSCAIAQHASLCWSGDKLSRSVNGSGIFEEVGAGMSHPAWQPNDGKALPARGDVLFWQTPGTNNGHIECVLRRGPDGTWTTAGGGGGADGTECSIRFHQPDAHGAPTDAYGRPLLGWWRVAMLGLPESLPVPAPDPKPAPPPAPVVPPGPVAHDVQQPPPGQQPPAQVSAPPPWLRRIGAALLGLPTLVGACAQHVRDEVAKHPAAFAVAAVILIALAIAFVEWLVHRHEKAAASRPPVNAARS